MCPRYLISTSPQPVLYPRGTEKRKKKRGRGGGKRHHHSGIVLPAGGACAVDAESSFLAPQLHPEYQLDRLLSLTTSWFSCTRRSGRGFAPENVVPLSLCDLGGDWEGGVETLSLLESPLRLDVSLLMPGKLPEEEGA